MDLKQTRHTPKQMVQKLREADSSLEGNIQRAEVMRRLEDFVAVETALT